MGFLKKIFGDPNAKELKKMEIIADKVMALDDKMKAMEDDELRGMTDKLRERLQAGETLDDILPEAFAACREAADRCLGMKHFRVQVIGGVFMHQGGISEMMTGEGKTLVATLPAYLNALEGKGVHIVTVNDYLARRDSEWMGKIFEFLGLSVGCVVHGVTPDKRREEYGKDITYGTNNEFGFDYLRDNMVPYKENTVQRELNYAIVDEVDSILIDEARTPLIISGGSEKSTELYRKADDFVRTLKGLTAVDKKSEKTIYEDSAAEDDDTDEEAFVEAEIEPKNKNDVKTEKNAAAEVETDAKAEPDEDTEAESVTEAKSKGKDKRRAGVLEKFKKNHVESEEEKNFDYIIEEKDKSVSLTERGVAKAEKYFDIDNFGDPEHMEINHHVQEALRAHTTKKRDVDYIIKDGEIIIVDENTGRLMFGRRYSGGLHQAIEAKEHVDVRSESRTLATVTLQNYFRMYKKLSGMTGTAKTEADEFRDIYNMEVLSIPPNKAVKRKDLEDAVFAKEQDKIDSIIAKIEEVHSRKQPILVGTVSVQSSERISKILNKRGVKHNVLNAKFHEQEADIVAEAGRLGAVTIATNMAGRGTDIILGGNPEFEAKKEMIRLKYKEEEISFATSFVSGNDRDLLKAREFYNELKEKYEEERAKDQQKVRELGGLYIIGTERHESRRIDNQLRGRSGRQGDPGVTQFYVSMEDNLMRLYGGEMASSFMAKFSGQTQPLAEHSLTSKLIRSAQKRIEGRNFEVRKNLLKYDNVMNKQREVIYEERRKVIFGDDIREYIQSMMEELIHGVIVSITAESKFAEEWDFKALNLGLKKINREFEGVTYSEEQKNTLTQDLLESEIVTAFKGMYAEKEAEVGEQLMRSLERKILLNAVDFMWMNHIEAMEDLKQGIGLRALGQIDPTVAYANEGFDMFEEMIEDIREETVRNCFSVTVDTSTERKIIAIGVEQKEVLEVFRAEGQSRGNHMSTNRKQRRHSQGSKNSPEMQNAPRAKADQSRTVRAETPKIGRNEDCPCGSGKKYKHCCGRANVDTVDIDREE